MAFKSYIFETEETLPQTFYFFEKGFSEEELEKIYNDVSHLPFYQATTAHDKINEARSSSVKWIPYTEEWEWLYEKIMNMAVIANNHLWKFDLISAPELIQYTEYYGVNGGKYDWHQDIGPGMLSRRKVSVTVQLSEGDEYEGGDLEIWEGGNTLHSAPRGRGNVIIFPSYMMHRVAPLTSGTRRSFVLWVGGEHYR